MKCNSEILIVDDEPTNLKLLGYLMESAGYQVRASTDPRLALESALIQPPDLILLDVKMPDMDGFEMCRRLRLELRTAEIPVIFISASMDLNDKVRGFTVGGVDYITKPIQREEVLARVATHLELAQLRWDLQALVDMRTEELRDANEVLRIETIERKKAEERIQAIADYTYGWESWLAPDGRLLWVNPAVEKLTGYSIKECEKMSDYPLPIVYEEDRADFGKRLRQAIVDKSTINDFDFRISHKNGSNVWVAISWQPIYNKHGKHTGLRTSVRDITERKQMEAELNHLATHDPLTGLHNHKVLEQLLDNEVHRAKRYNRALSVFMLDIDHFKQVNDTYGHKVGDEVLIHIARVLAHTGRISDYAARYGGEEFVIVLPETPLSRAEELAERLRKQIAGHSFPLENNEVFNITASIGISTYPEHGESWEDLLNTADLAMYSAKKAGRNCVKVMDSSLL